MNNASTILAAWLAALATSTSAIADEAVSPLTDTRLLDLDGETVAPVRSADAAPATVFVFTSPECPISNRYAPEMRRLYEKFSPRKVTFWLVYADPEIKPKDIRRHLTEYAYPCGALRDIHHDLRRRSGAQVTPEAVVVVPRDGGRIAYRGRIDDRHVDFGKARRAPRQRDLEAALTAIVAGKPVSNALTRAVGCFIPELR